jgi:flagellin-like hook-associated protein FlgL
MSMNVSLTSNTRSNLLSLSDTKSKIATIQEHLTNNSSVNSPLDDAFKYFASKSLTDRADDLTTRKDQIKQGVSTVTAASNALTSTESFLQNMKGILDSTRSGTGTQRGSYQSQINTLVGQVSKLVNDANYNGLNLVNSSTASLTVYFSDKADSKLNVKGVNFNVSKLFVNSAGSALAALKNATTMAMSADLTLLSQMGGFSQALSAYQLSKATVLALFNSHADKMQNALDQTIQKVRAQTAVMGNNVAVLNVRLDFTSNYVKTLQTGASDLTSIDLTSESAKLMALNTRQSIGTSALSMANQADQSVLQLLR